MRLSSFLIACLLIVVCLASETPNNDQKQSDNRRRGPKGRTLPQAVANNPGYLRPAASYFASILFIPLFIFFCDQCLDISRYLKQNRKKRIEAMEMESNRPDGPLN